MGKFEDDLLATRWAVRGLGKGEPHSADELEDHFHNALLNRIERGLRVEDWLGYAYKCVKNLVIRGKGRHKLESLREPNTGPSSLPDYATEIDVRSALLTLPYTWRLYIIEYYFEGYTLEEIAQRHKVTNQWVSKVIGKGLHAMRGRLGSDDMSSPPNPPI